jgi:hypothetical protein
MRGSLVIPTHLSCELQFRTNSGESSNITSKVARVMNGPHEPTVQLVEFVQWLKIGPVVALQEKIAILTICAN